MRSTAWTQHLTPRRAVATALAGAVAVAALLLTLGTRDAEAEGRFPDLLVDRGFADARIAQAKQRATGASAAALADGKASKAEYRAAVARTLDCLEAGVAGLDRGEASLNATPTEPTLSSDGFEYSYTFTVAGPMAGAVDDDFAVAERVSTVEVACQAEHLIDVQWTYQLAKRADPAYVDAIGRSFEACAKEAGADVDVHGRNATEVAVELSSAEARKRHPKAIDCISHTPSIVTDVASDPMEHTKP